MSQRAADLRNLFAVRKQMRAEEEAASAEVAARPEAASRPDVASSPEAPARQEIKSPIESKSSSLEDAASPEAPSALPANLAAYAESLAYGAGHLRLNHDYLDHVITLLNGKEQLLFIHILRYREGRRNYTVRLNFPLLEQRTKISARTLSKVASSLEARGLVLRFDLRQGKGLDQGFRFRIVMPSSLEASSGLEAGSRLEAPSDSKRTDLKEKNKKDYANCPDCKGTILYYPDGFDKGVKRCRHERLKGKPHPS